MVYFAGVRPPYPDPKIVNAAAQHDPDALTALYQCYSVMVRNTLARIISDPDSAEDAYQQTWLTVLAKLPQLERPSFFPAWLHRISVTVALQQLRSQGRRSNVISLFSDWELHHTRADENTLLRIDVERAVEALPVRMRELVKYNLAGLTLTGAAVQMGISIGTAKSQHHKARQKLARSLSAYQE